MKKLAIVQFGAAKDVTQAYKSMIEIKKNEQFDVRTIDILNLSEEDKKFLSHKNLVQINFIGHSATWDEKNHLIPLEDRKIGACSLKKACEAVFDLAKETVAIKYNFYPCEVADKFCLDGTEIRDAYSPDGILSVTTELSEEDLQKQQVDFENNSLSSLDILSIAILKGQLRHKRFDKPLTIGGQVGPGYPEHATHVGSPRISIKRELARKIINGDKEAQREAAKTLTEDRRKNNPPLAWIDQRFRLFKNYENVNTGNDPRNNRSFC